MAGLLLGLSSVAHSAVPINMNCGMSVKAFFTPLIQGRLINPKPFHVTPGSSLNQFRPKAFVGLTAFDLPVTTVVGFTDEPLLFTKVAEVTQDVYGVVVREGIGNVQAHLSSLGVPNARIFRVDAKATLILCKGEMQ